MPKKYIRGAKKRMGKKYKQGMAAFRKGGAYLGANAGAMAFKALRGVKYIRSLINVEKKVFDGSSTGATATNGGANNIWLSGITTGTAYNQRTGMVVKASNLYISFKCQLGASENISRIRFIVFRNKGLNQGANTTTSDIVSSVGVCDSPFNLDNVGDFEVVGTALVHLDSTLSRIVTRRMFIPLSHHIRWDTSGDAITDTEQGHLFVAYQGDSYTTNPPIFDYTFRLRYIDN